MVNLKTELGPVKLTAEIGHTGLHRTGGQITEEYDPDLRGVRGVRVYDEMRKADPIVATGLRAIRWVIGQVDWRVDAAGETEEDQEAKSFVESCIGDMSHTWNDFIQDALTCLPFGWAWLEVVYKLRQGSEKDPPSAYDDGKIGWRKLTLIGQDSLREWKFDEAGGIIGLAQTVEWNAKEKLFERVIPIEKSVLFRLDKEKNNPEGVSLLRPVYLPWYKKKMIEEIEAIGIERDLTGVLIIYLPVGATTADTTKAKELLEQFKADDMSGFIGPQFGPGEHERFRFEIINSPGSKSIDSDKVIQRYQMEMLRAFLAQFLMLGQVAGSWALSKDARGMFELAIGAIVQNVEETINRFLVPPLFRYNQFGQLSGLPKVKAGRIGRADFDRFEAIVKLLDAGVLTPDRHLEDYVRSELELPEKPEEEEKPARTKPEPTGQQASEEPEVKDLTEDDVPEAIDDDLLDLTDVDWMGDEPS